jgi:uncharacterized RDD family membrane protein YckC
MLLTQSFFNFFLVTLPYLGFLQAYLEGTLGKKLFGLATVSEDGGKLSAGQAFSRVFVSNFSAFFFCLGYIWVGFQPQKQGWHDLAARSVVVHKRALAQWRNTPQDQVTSQAA